MKPGNTGITRLVRAFGYSMQGFAAAFRHEAAFRQEMAATLVLVPLAIWWGETGVERALLTASWLLVPLTELLNSSIEAIVDKACPEQDELAGRAKDIGSAAVLLAIIMAAAAWGLVLLGPS